MSTDNRPSKQSNYADRFDACKTLDEAREVLYDMSVEIERLAHEPKPQASKTLFIKPLIERLRDLDRDSQQMTAQERPFSIFGEAADEIERLQREATELREIVEGMPVLASLSTAHEPSKLRDALDAIASPSRTEDYGWWTQVARRALGYATKNETAQPPDGYYTMAQISYALNRSLYAKTGNLAIEGIIEDLHAALKNGGDHPRRESSTKGVSQGDSNGR